jgi:hypothetical protein
MRERTAPPLCSSGTLHVICLLYYYQPVLGYFTSSFERPVFPPDIQDGTALQAVFI